MNSNTQIQIHFPQPGDWEHYILTALWDDDEGYTCRRTYHPGDLSEDQRQTLQETVADLVALDAPWQATHVTAFLNASGSEEQGEAIVLILDACRSDGACKTLTPAECPQLMLTDAAMLNTFRQMTCMQTT